MTLLASENPIDDDQPRRIVMHVNFTGEDRYTFLLNNVENIRDYYRAAGNDLEIRVVCHGPGLMLLRPDKSPVLKRLQTMTENMENLSLYACANTLDRMEKAEGKRPQVIDRVTLVAAGLPEIVELQRRGWVYLKP